MMKKNNSYSVISGGQQDAERSLLEYLKPKQEDRFSKLEAFCDLLSRTSKGASSCMCGDKKVDLLPGQFVATVSDLARTWQWQRATVRQFLEGLVTLGQVQMLPFVKSYVFTVSMCKRMTLAIESADDVLDFCIMQYARHTAGNLSAEQVAQSFDEYFSMKAEIAFNSENPSKEMTAVLQTQLQVLDYLLLFQQNRIIGKRNVAQCVVDSTNLLFGRDGLWKWQNVISCLDFLTDAFAQNKMPKDMTSYRNRYSSAELTLIDTLYIFYNKMRTALTSPLQAPSDSEQTPVSSLGENSGNDAHNASPVVPAAKSASDVQSLRTGKAVLQE